MHDADGAFCRSGKVRPPEAFPVRKQRMRWHIDDPMQRGKDKKDGPQTQANNRTQQPPQVVARGAQHSMQRIAGLPFEPATTHTVVVLHMADDRLNRLSSLEPAALRAGQCLVLSAMNQVYCDTSESTPRNPRSTNTVLGCGVPGRSCNRMELYSSCSA